MLDLYVARDSPLHALAPGWKILALAIVCSVLFAIDHIALSLGALCGTLVLYRVARLSVAMAWQQVRPAWWIFGLIFVAQLVFNSWLIGLFVILRFAVLLMLAGLLTLTTKSSDMIDGIEAGLTPLRRFGFRTEGISLAISLTLRFIPVLTQVVQEVREAQNTRGLERNPFAIAIPSIVRTIKISEEISDAIDARGF
ncbi:energy-coupling factor transporter transmembrane component T family protein [Epibacterium sp. Ofav1-8]|uniref:energy-coupling factor transporter transmembrane component T family protein n=1 Tax=Epibacterium sp. Ofav1-8 TaxID=2917735 RepID=UPI001EF5E6DB|nr:energy-coupling factor transporter transmembrane protein EcfT [Epibacterium sp. Ofav1-8]MCG7625421.1 energy-coupling factor transporter transmembrane protein EcfT [Epibacterium sp. Ofav1-8]